MTAQRLSIHALLLLSAVTGLVGPVLAKGVYVGTGTLGEVKYHAGAYPANPCNTDDKQQVILSVSGSDIHFKAVGKKGWSFSAPLAPDGAFAGEKQFPHFGNHIDLKGQLDAAKEQVSGTYTVVQTFITCPFTFTAGRKP